MRKATFVLVILVSAVLAAVPAAAAGSIRPSTAPIDGRYIVALRALPAEAPALAQRLTQRYGGAVRASYRHAFAGFAMTASDRVARAMAGDTLVRYVEQDGAVRAIATQSNPPWGLDRIDQRNLPLSASYTYNATGSGVTAYIIDTGIRFSHSDFGGRATSGRDTIGGDNDASDCNGHGTHVAGTVGGSAYGVAKQVSLIGVRVLDCTGSGSTSGVIAGVDWVTGHHVAGAPAVANMSLGGGASTSLDTAVRNSIGDGITYAIAAGNGNALGQALDACTVSPARVSEALTVGATDKSDRKASFSNYGTCLDIFAPGVDVKSAWYTSDTATSTISGTSMAAPHVAGAAALYLQGNRSASPAAVGSALTSNATTGKVTSAGSGSPNRLLYTGFIGSAPSNQAPSASFTHSCSELTCSFSDTSTDGDGTIASRSWNFGDGTTSTAANPTKTYAAGGTYTVLLTVTDDDGASASTSKSVTVATTTDPDPSTPTLSNGVARSDTNGARGTWKYYKISVPAGKSQLKVDLTGPSCGLLGCDPDLDLYVKRGAKPTASSYDCRPYTGSSTESCTISNPAADWWYVGVYVYSGSTSKTYSVKATY